MDRPALPWAMLNWYLIHSWQDASEPKTSQSSDTASWCWSTITCHSWENGQHVQPAITRCQVHQRGLAPVRSFGCLMNVLRLCQQKVQASLISSNDSVGKKKVQSVCNLVPRQQPFQHFQMNRRRRRSIGHPVSHKRCQFWAWLLISPLLASWTIDVQPICHLHIIICARMMKCFWMAPFLCCM